MVGTKIGDISAHRETEEGIVDIGPYSPYDCSRSCCVGRDGRPVVSEQQDEYPGRPNGGGQLGVSVHHSLFCAEGGNSAGDLQRCGSREDGPVCHSQHHIRNLATAGGTVN